MSIPGKHDNRQRIIIIGGGFSGTLTAAHLLRKAQQPIEIIQIEKRPETGKGLAYSTQCHSHLLNVRAKGMSAFGDDPDHFVAWAKTQNADYSPESFVSRPLYGKYVQEIFDKALAAKSDQAQYSLITQEAVDIRKTNHATVEVQLADGSSVEGELLVLATGHVPSQHRARHTADTGAAVETIDPWQLNKANIKPDESILLIGSGLTAIDTVVELLDRQHSGPIYAISRHGRLPRPHVANQPPLIQVTTSNLPKTARQTVERVRELVKTVGDWRVAVDSLRPITTDWWQQLPLVEQRRFYRHVQSLWDVHRHRMAPEIETRIQAAIASGQLRIISGRLAAIFEKPQPHVRIALRGGKGNEDLQVSRIFDCTGYATSPTDFDSRLIQSMLKQGLAAAHPLKTGFAVDADGRLLTPSGAAQTNLWTVGPNLKADRFESIAVPELKIQCERLADLLLDQITTLPLTLAVQTK